MLSVYGFRDHWGQHLMALQTEWRQSTWVPWEAQSLLVATAAGSRGQAVPLRCAVSLRCGADAAFSVEATSTFIVHWSQNGWALDFLAQ